MGALKTLVVDVPWMAGLFGLDISFELVVLSFNVDHFLRFVVLCIFSCGISYAFVVGLFDFHVMTYPIAVSGETSPRS